MTDSAPLSPASTGACRLAARLGKFLPVAGNTFIAVVLLLTASSISLRAAESAAASTNSARVPNRWLLVVETSRAMQRRVMAVESLVNDLLSSGFGGQLHSGDTLGVWTFNDELQTGKLPLQRWSSRQAAEISARVTDFVRQQKFGRGANPDKAMGPALMLLRDPDLLTIVLITSGEQKLRGTPYDDRMAESLGLWLPEQQRRQLPFLTIIRGSRGRITDCAMTPSQWPLDMPALPPDKVIAKIEPKPVSTIPNTPSRLSPLIVKGARDPEPRPQLKSGTTVPNISTPPSQGDGTAAPSATTGQTNQVSKNEPAAAPKRADESASARDLHEGENTTAITAVIPDLVIQNPAPVATAAVVKVPELVSSNVPTASPGFISTPNPVQPEISKSFQTSKNVTSPAETGKRVAADLSTNSPAISQAKAESEAPKPHPPEPLSTTASTEHQAEWSEVSPSMSSEEPPKSQTLGTGGFFKPHRAALLGGIILVLATLFTVILLLRHRNTVAHASLITRSFERREGVSYRGFN